MSRRVPECIQIKHNKAATAAAKRVLQAVLKKAFDDEGLVLTFPYIQGQEAGNLEAVKVHRQLLGYRQKLKQKRLEHDKEWERLNQVKIISPKIVGKEVHIHIERVAIEISHSTQSVLNLQDRVKLDL